MNYYNYLNTFQKYIEKGNFAEAEKYAINVANQLKLNPDLIKKIIAVSLSSYQQRLEQYLPICLERAKVEQAKAICLYYDLDNGWDSTFFISQHYHPTNSDWISMSRSWINIGRVRGLNKFYRHEAQYAFFADEISTAICLLVISKTTMVFWHALEKFRDSEVKICITCTDSDFIRLV